MRVLRCLGVFGELDVAQLPQTASLGGRVDESLDNLRSAGRIRIPSYRIERLFAPSLDVRIRRRLVYVRTLGCGCHCRRADVLDVHLWR